MTARVLIVDDSLTIRMDLAEAFTRAGFDPVVCADAQSARATAATERIDLAIVDVVLPDADGVQLVEELKAALGATTPVLMLSSEAEIQARVRGLSGGADEYVGKPYDTDYLVRRARTLLKHTTSGNAQPTILLIDDSATFRAELSKVMTEEGYQVTTAASAEDGIQMLAHIDATAIVVDGMLPGMDGPSFIRHIRLDAALRGLPCILLTAAEEVDAELRALDSGADAFVRKDGDAGVLLARLNALLRSAPESRLVAETSSLSSRKKILAVDDSATYRQSVADALGAEGYEVILATSGEEAIELLSVQRVDCVLLDVVMPGIGGKETCRRIKSSPVARDIPVIVLTALENREAMLDGLATGADDFIPKSAEFEVLKARVRAQLRRRQFEEETRSVRERLLRSEYEAEQARAAQELAETRAQLVNELERKNEALELAYRELQATQAQLIQSAKMASLGELVAGVAHEINNPLAFITSHIESVSRWVRKLPHESDQVLTRQDIALLDKARNRLEEVSSGLVRIRELVVKLRTFSRLDEGELKIANIAECIDSVLRILAHRTKNRIVVETSYGPPDEIHCYPGLLNQALMNLIANAIEAIEGPGLIQISGGQHGDTYQIRIVDNGPGIPEGVRERVFEPFFTTKPVGQGTGLGLSIAYSIVKAHHGTLHLRAREGGGTDALIIIPLSQELPQGEVVPG